MNFLLDNVKILKTVHNEIIKYLLCTLRSMTNSHHIMKILSSASLSLSNFWLATHIKIWREKVKVEIGINIGCFICSDGLKCGK